MRAETLIAIALVLAPLSSAAPVAAKETASALARPTGSAERDGDKLTLRWTGLGDAVTVWQVPRGDALAKDGTVVGNAIRGSETVVVAAASPRPYFVVRDDKGHELRLAESLLPLEGGVNFRDLGGYRGAGGKPVAWGHIYRSAVMSGLTAADFRYLNDLGIGAVCDLRANEERDRDPVNWPAEMNMRVLVRDYKLDMAPLMTLFTSGGDVSAEKTRAAMTAVYADMPFSFASQYKEMFGELLKSDRPLAFNCSAGKDRTGLAAALVLSALGVPRETVIEDYLLSNRYYKPKPPKPGAAPDPTMAMFARLPPDVVQALMGVDRQYIEAAFAAIDAKGGMSRYLRENMGLGPAELTRLRSLYLQS
ncbi:tyrosine-protein phosphatase [Polymorphobacter fuscus]|uniref:Protein-tyrosine-phosphatase n=1 Tax=Sandarakinorhabdus fusca TaxID=1439888 RepID=A0A7C9LFH4_9SPHN|nr:tyrosine-protein phosphatase [Polymorphobacter fuscus]KAB7647453.1 tyrosine-protein phosphatase [Polymorphobacter fuscus]MQT16707.1 hypothetical protein [Polymorphobacter fuscus]NJC09306.1 protein-tyrosine phosphatase [Polymorphobacter fuscus]